MQIAFEADKIEAYQDKLIDVLLRLKHKKIRTSVGYNGGSFQAEVHWFDTLGFWFLHEKFEDDKYWNAFGVQDPSLGHTLSITCEINFSLAGINRRVAGTFIEDHDNIYIAHRGRIGGSHKGGGKKLFLQHYRGKWIEVDDGGKLTNVALVGSLGSANFPHQLKEFVFRIREIKDMPRDPHPHKSSGDIFEDDIFSNEFFGVKKYNVSSTLREAQCNHGVIVSNLAKKLENKGYKIANDIYRDLYILGKQGQIKVVFEVKTDNVRDSLYGGVGQLLLNNFQPNKSPTLILVLPEKLQPALLEKIGYLGIDIITYRWGQNKYIFDFNNCTFPEI